MLENLINNNIISGILLSTGLIFLFSDFLLPRLGMIGISGLTLYTIGFIIALLSDATIIQVLASTVFTAIVLLIIFSLILNSQNTGVFTRLNIVKGSNNPKKEILNLLDKEGIISSSCDPMGRVKIDTKYYNAIPVEGHLHKGEKVKVIDIDDSLIIVKRIENNKEKVEVE